VHLSWGSVPLQRSTVPGARMTPDVPPSGTIRPQGFSPSRRFASPKTMRGLFHPRCAHGVSPDPQARQYLSVPAGPTLPGLLSKALSPPVTTASPAASSHALRRFRLPGSRRSCDQRAGQAGMSSSFPKRIPTGATESRSRRARCIPRWRTASTGLPEVCDRPSHSRLKKRPFVPGLPLSS
jgi:hypothetical protein